MPALAANLIAHGYTLFKWWLIAPFQLLVNALGILVAIALPRINEFTINQLVAPRLASDAALPDLDHNLSSRKAIKQMIQNWRADYQRI